MAADSDPPTMPNLPTTPNPPDLSGASGSQFPPGDQATSNDQPALGEQNLFAVKRLNPGNLENLRSAQWTAIANFLKPFAQTHVSQLIGQSIHIPALFSAKSALGNTNNPSVILTLSTANRNGPELETHLYLADILAVLYQIAGQLENTKAATIINNALNKINFRIANTRINKEQEDQLINDLATIGSSIYNAAGILLNDYLAKFAALPPEEPTEKEKERVEDEAETARRRKAEDITAGTPPKKPSPPPPEEALPEPDDQAVTLINERYLTSAYADLVLNSTIAYLGFPDPQAFADQYPDIYQQLQTQSFDILNGLIVGLNQDQLHALRTTLSARVRLLRDGHNLLIKIPGVVPLLQAIRPQNQAEERTAENFDQHLANYTQEQENFFTAILNREGFSLGAYHQEFLGRLTPYFDSNKAADLAINIEAAVLAGSYLSVVDGFIQNISDNDPQVIEEKFARTFSIRLSYEDIIRVLPILRGYWLAYRAYLMNIEKQAGIEYRSVAHELTVEEFEKQYAVHVRATKLVYLEQAGGRSHEERTAAAGDYVRRMNSSYEKLQTAGDTNSAEAVQGFWEIQWEEKTFAERTIYYQTVVLVAQPSVQLDAAQINATPSAPSFYQQLENTQLAATGAAPLGEEPTQFLNNNQSWGQDTQNALANSSDAASAAKASGDALAQKAGQLAIRAGLNAAAAGAGEAYMKARELAKYFGGEKAFKKVEEGVGKTVKVAAGVLGITAGSMIYYASQAVSNPFSFLGGAIGFLTGGPAGAVKGIELGHQAWDKVTSPFTGGDKPSRVTFDGRASKAGTSSVAKTTRGLARPPQTVPPYTPTSVGHTAGAYQPAMFKGAAPTTTKIGAWEAFFTNIGASAPITTSVVVIGGAALTMMTIQAAFLVKLPHTEPLMAVGGDYRESKYLFMEKRVETGPGCKNNSCKNTVFPFDVTYHITIRPKGNYSITITDVIDKLTVTHNKEKYSGDPPKIEEERGFEHFPGVKNGDVLAPGQELTLTYSKNFTENEYHDASVRNKITIKFNYDNGQESGTDDAITGEVLCIGECPQGLGCWPTSGIITQLPFGDFSHISKKSGKGTDAFDIGTGMGKPIFAPFTGTACHYTTSDEGYGISITLDAEVDGQSRQFLFAHLSQRIEIKEDCQMVQEGEIIGRVGSTGRSTGPHLHFAIKRSEDTDYYYLDGADPSDFPSQSELARIMPDGEFINRGAAVRSCFIEGL